MEGNTLTMQVNSHPHYLHTFFIHLYGFILAFEEFCTEILGINSEVMIQPWYGYDDRYIHTLNKIKDYMKINQVEPDEKAKNSG